MNGARERRLTIRSGGQTGVDRAALVVAAALGLKYTGWCPKGGWAEDFTEPPGILELFPKLRETPSTEPAQRTGWNVRDADATLILTTDPTLVGFPGTRFTRTCADFFRKPLWIAALDAKPPEREVVAWLQVTLGKSGPRSFSLNVAGPRESEAPGIFQLARDYLLALLENRVISQVDYGFPATGVP